MGESNPLALIAPQCRFCDSPYTAKLREVPLRRMSGAADVYYCMNCECFWHPQVYVEPDDQLKRDAEWHISVEERNARWADNFLNAALQKAPIQSILEIGCGTGTLLSRARDRGLRVTGHDTNPYVAAIARERHNLEISNAIWTQDTTDEKVDLIVSISTLEHLTDPRSLLSDIAAYCKRHGSQAYLSVPFISERKDWGYLLEETPKEIANPFYLVDVHINHFSKKGFAMMCAAAGATTIEFFPRGWIGYWLKFD